MLRRVRFCPVRRKHLVFLALIALAFAFKSHYFEPTLEECPDEEPIDAVYTWVNGSDLNFRADLMKYLNERRENDSHLHFLHQRFDDKHELKFSLRSLEKHAPWIRHVYIVTNGQIPYWLDLDYERVTLVTHEEIFDDARDLPTFSSPAIESHLHKIPGLSRRFVYLNDDIFFGAPVHRDDFHSPSRGFLVHLAYPLPQCAVDCPWIYVSDGQCDTACLNSECQMDGGDCKDETEAPPTGHNISEKASARPRSNAMELLLLSNQSSANYSGLVSEHNAKIMRLEKLSRKKKRLRLFGGNSTLIKRLRGTGAALDTYSASLQHTNRRLNLKYKFVPRQVPAHAPLFVDVQIATELRKAFAEEFEETSRHKIRSADDMQFAFAYYYFVMHEERMRAAAEIFDLFDTDASGTWSDREIRTILTKLYELPLSFAAVDHFELLLQNCTTFGNDFVTVAVSTPEFERYVDSKLPTITKELITGCATLVEILTERFGVVPRYKYEILKHSHEKHVAFKMLSSNVSDVVGHLDEIRRNPRKFVCLNDNLDDVRVAENHLVRAVLYDFYLSLFPRPSRFELPVELRNRFQHLDELREWKDYRLRVYFLFFAICLCAVFVLFKRRRCRRAVGLLLWR